MNKRIILLALAICVPALNAFARPADEAPAWLQDAAAQKPPIYDKDVPAVVLRNQQTVTVSADGKVTSSTVFAVRILTREGRVFAEASELYLPRRAT